MEWKKQQKKQKYQIDEIIYFNLALFSLTVWQELSCKANHKHKCNKNENTGYA